MTSWSPSLELPAGCDPAPALPAPAVATVAAIVGSDITAGTAQFSGVLRPSWSGWFTQCGQRAGNLLVEKIHST